MQVLEGSHSDTLVVLLLPLVVAVLVLRQVPLPPVLLGAQLLEVRVRLELYAMQLALPVVQRLAHHLLVLLVCC